MRVIVGLGNPGEQHANQRHNLGWMAIDAWLGDVAWQLNKRFNALLHEDGSVLYVKPLSYMNDSGLVVRKILDYYKLLPKSFGLLAKKEVDLNDTLTVIHDELDLDFRRWRLASNSSSAGNRGVQSIIDHLKTQKFRRLRLGIKNELLRTRIPADKFVLQPFTLEERSQLNELFKEIRLEDLK